MALESPFPAENLGSTVCPPSPPATASGTPASVPSRTPSRRCVRPGGQLSGLLPQLCLSAAGVGGLHRPLPGHRHTGTGGAVWTMPGGRRSSSGFRPARRRRFSASGSWAASSARAWTWRGDRLIGCAIVGVGLPQVVPARDAAPLLRRPERGGLRLRLPLARDEQSPAGRRAGHPDAGR